MGTQLLLWAHVNGMSATATHLHAIMRTARDLAAAAPAAAPANAAAAHAAASQQRSNTGLGVGASSRGAPEPFTAAGAGPAAAAAAVENVTAAATGGAGGDRPSGSQHGGSSSISAEASQLQAPSPAASVTSELTPVQAWKFEDVDCKAAGTCSNTAVTYTTEHTAASSRSNAADGAVLMSPSDKDGGGGVMLPSASKHGSAVDAAPFQQPTDLHQSPLPLIKMGVKVLVTLVALYLLFGLIRGVLSGEPAMHQLKSSLASLQYAARVLCIPLVLLGSGIVMALLQQLPGLGQVQRQQQALQH